MMFFRIYGLVFVYLFGVWALLRQLLKLCRDPLNRFNFLQQEGKVFIVTGGSRGIGRSIVKRLLNLGAFVIITGRGSPKVASKALEGLTTISSRFRYVQLELESMEDVAKFCEMIKKDYERLDGIVCNAGCLHGTSRLTSDNLEPQQAVNYFSNVLMIENLKPLLRGNNSRVVLVSSAIHRLGYCNLEDFMFKQCNSPHLGYVQSKLCQIAYARYRGRQFLEEGFAINAVHPGVVATSFYKPFLAFIGSFIFLSPASGAEVVVYALLSTAMEGVSGQYLEFCEFCPPAKRVLDGQFQKALYDLTIRHLQPWLVTE